MYKVIKPFTDLQDRKHVYRVGDEFPRAGLNVSEERLKELASGENKRGVPLIEEVYTKKAVSEVKEEPQEEKVDITPPKKPRAKRGAKKTQE